MADAQAEKDRCRECGKRPGDTLPGCRYCTPNPAEKECTCPPGDLCHDQADEPCAPCAGLPPEEPCLRDPARTSRPGVTGSADERPGGAQ